ncbi:MAG TPA: hypothetical protein PKC76_19520 [Saprospiraceae bacterium]|nr:hypothetical protein [Saprospiraceae bacterium]
MVVFVRVLSENQWFGAWAPLEALQSETDETIFILADNDFTQEDEYEFFEPGTEVRVETFTDEHGDTFLGVVDVMPVTEEPIVVAK